MALDGTLTSVAEPRGGQAYHLVSAEDGRIWYTVDGYGSLGAYDPATGVFDDYFIDVSNFSGLATGRDGDLWVAGTNLLKKVSLTGAVLDAISIPAASFEYLQPASLVAGVDTELYFVLDEHRIGWIDHAGTLRTSRPPYTGVSLARLSITSYNSVWYTDRGRGTLGNV
jgi:streptogramin lyase